MDLTEISDRLEIEQLLARYADIIDRKAFAELVDVFTDDAFIDYSVFGGAVGTRTEIIEFLDQVMGLFPHTQHLVANLLVTIDGDTGTGRIMCFNPQEVTLEDGGTQVMMLGLWYVDEYRRTPAGWRISKRVEERSWVHNTPGFMPL